MQELRNFKSKPSIEYNKSNFYNPYSHKICPLAELAAQELQEELAVRKEFNSRSVGKMYGVLVVENSKQELSYLAAFSGKIEERNQIEGFVPPVYNLLNPDAFYKKGEAEINLITQQLVEIENDPKFIELVLQKENLIYQHNKELKDLISQQKYSKLQRANKRESTKTINDPFEIEKILKECNDESSKDHYELKDLKKKHKAEEAILNTKLLPYYEKIEKLKDQRKNYSSYLQNKIFDEFSFLNSAGELKNLKDIFNPAQDELPPSGAGECAAPKLLQYAFQNNLKIISLAEFWWGGSPSSEIRKHKHFYPPCRSKCAPILKHMLSNTDLDEVSYSTVPDTIEIPILFEDEHIVVINKPHNFLSVPGLTELTSIYDLMKEKYPDATGPLIVHRLDMATSGIMIIAKTLISYHNLQVQFAHRKVKKTYAALLDGKLNQSEGEINLPIRVDLEDRPRQMVCYEHGKTSLTKYKVIDNSSNITRIEFYPHTGRTHQLRVHAAHPLGLNTPIVGDELYGKVGKRLMLHASNIQFLHPILHTEIRIACEPKF